MDRLEDAVSTYDENPTPVFDHGIEGFYETSEHGKLRYGLAAQGLRITSVEEGGSVRPPVFAGATLSPW